MTHRRLSIYIFCSPKPVYQPDLRYCGVIKKISDLPGLLNNDILMSHLIYAPSHRKKREAKIKRDVKRGIREANEQNPFEIFVTVTDIRYTYVRSL